MRKITNAAVFILFSIVLFTSCKKEVNSTQSDFVSQEAIAKIAALGFSTSNVQKVDEGYLVEGDIILTNENLNSGVNGKLLRVANTEQYRTTNLVTGTPRTIVISTSGTISATLSNGINQAIARYNAENLLIKFSRGGTSGGGNINIRVVNTNQYIASSGFPTGGNPYFEVKYAKTYTTNSWSLGFVSTVIAHEVGHCIGFRHTDYMDRSYSCGGTATNEGASSIGAILIPGTPSGPDALSWMLACLSATTDRPFNANDKTALNYLY